MAVPISQVGSAPRYPCTDHDLDRRIRDVANKCAGGTSFPIGGICLYTGTVASLPSGFVLANGSLNSGGSGFDLRNVMIKCVVADAVNGVRVEATQTVGPGYHDHSFWTDERLVHGFSEYEKVKLKIGNPSPATHDHSGKTGPGRIQVKPDGEHWHGVLVQPASTKSDSKGGHDHPTVSGNEDTPLSDHSTLNVVSMVKDVHPDHHHGLGTDGNASEGVRAHGLVESGSTEVAGPLQHLPTASGNALDHLAHTHPTALTSEGAHVHEGEAHDHHVTVRYSGLHTHPVDNHTHGYSSGDWTGTPTHEHTVEAGVHRHYAVLDPHRHVGVSDNAASGHAHDTGEPLLRDLIPIERIS